MLAARLDGNTVVVLQAGQLDRYDATGGNLVASWPVAAGATLAGVANGIAATTAGTTITLTRLTGGTTATINVDSSGPISAVLDRAGLFYAYQANDPAYPGRVTFISYDQLPLH